MNVIATPVSAGGRVSQKEINVIGTMQLLAACQKAPGIRRLVVKSSAAVYGSSPRDPAMFTEDMGPKALPRAGFGKDSVEVEGYVRGFSRRRPDVEISMLRLANIIGPGIRTGLTDYFTLPVIPVPFGLRRPPAVRARGRLAAGACCWRPPVRRSASSTSRATASSPSSRPPGWPAGPRCPVPMAATGLLGPVRPALRAGRLLPRPDAVPRLRAGHGHHPHAPGRCTSSPRFTTRAAFEDFIAQAGTGLPGQAVLASVADSLAGTAAGVLSHAVPRRGASDGRSGRRADARRRGRRGRPAPRRGSADALAAGAARASGERARRRRTPLLSDPAAPDEGAAAVEGPRATGSPACGGRDGEGGRPAGAARRRSTGPGRCRAPRRCAWARRRPASGRRRARRGPAPAVPSARTDAPALSSVPEPSARDAARGRRPPARRPRSLSGIEELVHVAVAVLRLAAEASGLSGEDVERQVAGTLAFLRRRLSGDYTVDEFGFDEDFTEHAYLPLLRPLYRSWFRVEVRGIENIPAEGGALVVANHSGTIALDSLMTQVAVHDEHPAHRHLRMLGADLVFQTPVRRRGGPQERLDPGGQRRRRAAAGLRRAGRCLARGLQGRRQAVQRALQAAAVRPRRVRLGGPAHRGADHPVLDRGRRGDLPDPGQPQDGRPADRRAVRAGHPDLPAARPAGPDPAAEQVDHRVRGAGGDRRRSARPRRTTRCWCSTSPTRCARRSSRRSTRC